MREPAGQRLPTREPQHLTIPCRVLDVPGETIWQVANRQGIEIPHLCWLPKPGNRADGNCRACMGDGARKTSEVGSLDFVYEPRQYPVGRSRDAVAGGESLCCRRPPIPLILASQGGGFRVVGIAGDRPVPDLLNGFIDGEKRDKKPFSRNDRLPEPVFYFDV